MLHVPRLVLADAAASAPPAPSPDTPGVHTWRNKHGGVVATGQTIDRVHWMHWPYLAAYRFAADDPAITAFALPNAPLHTLEDTYRRSVVPMALQALGFEALHASAVLLPAGVVGFFAASETGKSTLAYGLSERGFPQWGDDSLLFDPSLPPVTSRRLPFDVRLRPESRSFFDNTDDGGDFVMPLPDTAPVRALFLLTRDDRSTLSVRQLDPVGAFSGLVAHAHCFNPHNESRRTAMLSYYMQVIGAVPVYEVIFPPVLSELGAVLDAVLAVVAPEVGDPISSRGA
jgi:hypothetical protein